MEVLVLGPLELRAASGPVALGGGKQQVLVAMLALRAPQYVPRDMLVDALWPETPPPSARHAIESYVSRARRVLRGPDGGDGGLLIESGPAGYRLEAATEQVDGLRFEALARDGDAALGANAPDEAARLLGGALDLWR
ncbi:MAG: winged helix-turn-helix domain-containing protein, partial [Solirubrobacteraceae bacterium]|nr:winged helix-turn-helix domain-containing protein [Solirubrobacteraceae bacterium]